MARELQEKLDAAERARGVQVSELRSDTHNLMQRFTLEHRDMGRALRSRLTSGKHARIEATRQGRRANQTMMSALRAQLRADARSLHTSLRTTNNARTHATRQTIGEVAADLRQASRSWREELKKKGASSVAEALPEAAAAVEEVAQPLLAVEEPAREVPAETPRGEEAVEERQVGRAYAEAERVLSAIQTHPDGIRLVEIGNELGVDWRGLIGVVRSLVDEGKVEKIDNTYYPAQR